MSQPLSRATHRPGESRRVRRSLTVLIALACAALTLALAAPAIAGQASAGELLFYPCTDCHPVTESGGVTSKPLPNGFKGHGIVLSGHQNLGVGQAACLACHDDPAKNPGMLKLADGSLIDIKGDVARVCYRCHSGKYLAWKTGAHGKHAKKCTAGGCHDPHTPGFIYSSPVMPFIGTGTQFQVLSQTEPFLGYAMPAPEPQVRIPWWFSAIAVVGVVAAGGLLGTLLIGRSKR